VFVDEIRDRVFKRLAAVEFLEKELTEALNSAFSSARTAMQERMKEVTGSLGIDLPAF
jgi:DNA-binding protein YbaB